MMEKQERFRLFLDQLATTPAAANSDEALGLLTETLNRIEDTYSGVLYAPAEYLNDGRMYPPQADAARAVEGRPGWTRYRSRSHNTWITADGAIRITTVSGNEIVFEKWGRNGSGFE